MNICGPRDAVTLGFLPCLNTELVYHLPITCKVIFELKYQTLQLVSSIAVSKFPIVHQRMCTLVLLFAVVFATTLAK